MMSFLYVFICLFILFPFSTAAPINASTQTENINNNGQSFESKLDAASLPEFRLLNLLAHPDNSILYEQNPFYNKTELILAIGAFSSSVQSLPTLNAVQEQFSEKWVAKGGEQGEMTNLFGAIDEIIKNAQIAEADVLRTTLIALYAIGGRILSEILDDKKALKKDDDEVFVFGLKKAFTKVERVLTGLDQNEQKTVINEELLEKVAGIGNKLEDKFGKLENEKVLHTQLGTILAGESGSHELIGQLVAQSIDERMAEVADPNGEWGYVKKNDNNDDENAENEEEEKQEGKNEEQNGEETGKGMEENAEMKADNDEGEEISEAGNAKGNNPNDGGQNEEANEDEKDEKKKEPKEVEDEEKKQNKNEIDALEQNNGDKEGKKEMDGSNQVKEPKEGKEEEKKKEKEEKNETKPDEKLESEKVENDEEEEEEEKKEKEEIEEKKEDVKNEAIKEKADEKEETSEMKEKEDEQEVQMKERKLGENEEKIRTPEEEQKMKKFTSNDIDAAQKENI